MATDGRLPAPRRAPWEPRPTPPDTGAPAHPPTTAGARADTERSRAIDTETTPARPSVAVRVLVAVLEFYRRYVSPLFLPHCRFHPSCSAYAVGAVRTHGALVGTGLTLVRVAKCAPWHPGGLDPVPPRAHRTRFGWPAWPSRTADPGTDTPHTEEQASC